MKPSFVPLLILFGIISVAFASDWDQKFSDVCKYDQFCLRLKTSDGAWLRPKAEIVAILKDKDIQNQVKASAAQYGVDALALAGAILAENSLNVGLADSVQNFLAKRAGITSLGSRQFTFGLGQIGLPAAVEAENHVAKIEGRSPKNRDELVAELVDPAGSIRVAAAILRKVQDDYMAEGFDISKDPALLTTLYNLGKSQERAKLAKSSGLMPRQNYFGLFVTRYTGELQKIFGTSKALAPVVPASAAKIVPTKVPEANSETRSAPSAPKDPKVEPDRAPAKLVVQRQQERVTAAALKSSVALVSQPMQCRSTDYGQDPEREAKSITYGAPLGVMEAGAVYTEISRALDCKSKVWKLIKDEKGQSGWIQEDRLEAATIQKLVPKLSCRPSPEQLKCIASIRAMAGDLAIEDDLENGLLYLKPVTAPKSKETSFANEDRQCGFNPEIQENRSRKRQGSRMGSYPTINATKVPIAELQAKAKEGLSIIRSEMKRMSAAIGLAVEDLESPMNPYQRAFQIMYGIERDIRECYDSTRSENISCRVSDGLGDDFKKALGEMKYKKNPPIVEVMEASRKLENTYYSNQRDAVSVNFYFNHSDELTTAATSEIVRESLINCESRLTALQEKAAAAAKNSPTSTMPPYPAIPPPSSMPTIVSGGGGAISPGMVMGMGLGGFGSFGGGLSGMIIQVRNSDLFRTIKSAKPEDIEKHKAILISAARYCHGRLNLLEKTDSKNPLDCTEAPEIVSYQFQNFAKEYVRNVIGEDSGGLMSEVLFGVQSMVPKEVTDELRGNAPPPPLATPVPIVAENETRGSYCPNRTAEMIEALLQEYSCISRAFVPTDFLSKKLSQNDQRVVFRKFEKEDRFAVEVGVGVCSPVLK